MSLRRQLQWGGLWIIAASALLGGANLVIHLGYQNLILQTVYGIGFTMMILACTIIHMTQARRSGIFGLVAYLITVLSLLLTNVDTFLILADFAGIERAMQIAVAIWDPILHMAVYGIYVGLFLLGVSVAQTGILPRWGGTLTALGISLQVPSQFAVDIVRPMYFIFSIGGSILFIAGLTGIGWALWSGRASVEEEPTLSSLDRFWGAPFLMFSALLMAINAYINSIPDLTLADGVVHMISTMTWILLIVILHNAQADRAGGTGLAGFFLIHLGATLNFITAYFIMAQLAGQIEDNRALMASWVDIPIGRYGMYMLLIGILLFGVSVIRAGVFPRGAGWLVVIGIALSLPSQFTPQDYLFSIFSVIGAAIQGAGFGWMGWTLLRRRDQYPLQPA